MSRELYKAELLAERAVEVSATGKVRRLVRKYQILKDPRVDPHSAVFLASAAAFAAMPRFSFYKQPAPYADMFQQSCVVTEDPASHGVRVFFEQTFVLSSEDGGG